MWVVRYSLLSPDQVHDVVERAYKYHFNALMLQVRGRGDAYYHSTIEPRAAGLANQPDYFDPLEQAIEEAHAHGIKVFAWVNTLLAWSGKQPPPSPMHVVNRHPEWIDARPDGTPMAATDYEGQFLNPGIPAVRKYTVRICRDLVRRYDLDGIHLDYIRYPAPGLGYNSRCVDDFYRSSHPDQPDPSNWNVLAAPGIEKAAWTRWKQDQVTDLVREIRSGVQAEKPWVSVSAAVWSNLDDARYNRMQDWPTWLEQGLVDFVCPMAYSTQTPRVVTQIRQAVRLAHGRQIWAGLGAWQMSPASTVAKIRAVRALGAAGICLFSYDGMTDGGSSDHYLAALSHTAFSHRSSLPVMPWLPDPMLASRPTTHHRVTMRGAVVARRP